MSILHFLALFFRLPAVRDDKRHRVLHIAHLVRRLRWAVALVATGLVTGTLGYVIIEGYSWFDAYYMSVITLATVGFGEIHPLSFAGRVFTSFLIIFNIGLFAYAISTISSIFAEGSFSKLLREFNMQKRIQELRNHTIICGYGRHANEVVEELKKHSTPFVIIEHNRDKVDTLREATHLLFVEGDATDDDILKEAGVEHAAALILTMPSDADNLYVTLSARQMNPGLRIISRALSTADESKLRRAGANFTVVPERIGGFYMATLVDKPDLVEFFTLLSNMGPGNVVFEEIPVSYVPQHLLGASVADTALLRQSRVSLIAVRHGNGQYELNPAPETPLYPDQHLVILGNQEQINTLKSAMNS